MDSGDKVKQQKVAVSDDDIRIASFAALAILIHIAESALPSLVPGVKPGLANVVTLICLQLYGAKLACWVALLRVIVGSLLLGTFLGPPFMLSLSGALASLVLLLLLHKWNDCCTGQSQDQATQDLATIAPANKSDTSTLRRRLDLRVGAVGMSIIAAQAHIVAQFVVAYQLFVPHPGIFSLLPVMLTAALLFGALSGMIANVVLRRMSRNLSPSATPQH